MDRERESPPERLPFCLDDTVGGMPDDIPVVMDALPKLRELFSVKVNGSEGDREGGLGHSDGKER